MFLKRIFTWWNGATFGVLFTIAKRGRFVGEDQFGQRYYEAKTIRDGDANRRRRWVIYKGYAEPSKMPAERPGWPLFMLAGTCNDIQAASAPAVPIDDHAPKSLLPHERALAVREDRRRPGPWRRTAWLADLQIAGQPSVSPHEQPTPSSGQPEICVVVVLAYRAVFFRARRGEGKNKIK